MDLQKFIKLLEKQGELVRIREKVSPSLQITEITDRMSKLPGGGKALLFDSTGTDFPVLINSLGSAERIRIAFRGASPDDLSNNLSSLLETLTRQGGGFTSRMAMLPKLKKISSWIPSRSSSKGSCQQIVMNDPDLDKLPVLTCWPKDGGPFITLPMVHTQDPETGQKNLGMYRMQVFSKTETGMHWQLHKTGARHFRTCQRLGRRMPVTVTLGGDPVYSYCATAPLPEGIDEYLLAGFIRQKGVKLVRCLTNELWVPEDVDFVIEGYVEPDEPFRREGPFGDHTGFYSLEDDYPVFHVTAITHRKDAVYPATIVGIPPQEDATLAWVTEKLFMPAIRMTMMPELLDLHLPPAGVAHNIALFCMQPEYPGHARKLMHSIWGGGQMMFTKYAVAMPADLKLRDYLEVLRTISRKVDPLQHLELGYGPLDVLDHAAEKPFEGGKLGIDASGLDLSSEILNAPAPDATRIMSFRSSNPDIVDLNLDSLKHGISAGLISIRKSRKGQLRELADEIRLTEGFNRIRFWLLYDAEVDLTDVDQLVWIMGSHTDLSRDAWIYAVPAGPRHGILFLDCTRKTREYDGFEHRWPNPVVMDQKTIDWVDSKWTRLGLGGQIPSPSVKYRCLSKGSEAVAE